MKKFALIFEILRNAAGSGSAVASPPRNIGSDYFLTDQQLRVSYKKGFARLCATPTAQAIPAGGMSQSLCEPIYDSARTYFTSNF